MSNNDIIAIDLSNEIIERINADNDLCLKINEESDLRKEGDINLKRDGNIVKK